MKPSVVRWRALAFASFVVCIVCVMGGDEPPTDVTPNPPPAEPECANQAQAVDVTVNITRKPGHCIWKGECITNKYTDGKFNCFYNGPAVTYDKQNNSEVIQLLKEVCPWYVKSDDTATVCCDRDQLNTLKTQTSQARSLLHRCEACFQNVMTHFCATTCDPDMSQFMDPVQPSFGSWVNTIKSCKNSDGKDVTFVEAVNVVTDPSYAEDMYDSCKNVQYTEQPGPVINLMCGTDNCNYRKYLYFLGDPDLDYKKAPFFMNYDFTVHPYKPDLIPLKKSMLQCFNAGNLTCSCTDCPSNLTCPYIPIPAGDNSHWLFYYTIGMATFGFTLSFLTAAVAMLFALWDGAKRKSYLIHEEDEKKREDDMESTSSSINSDVPEDVDDDSFILCKAGAYLEFVIKAGFYRWGHFASKRWYIVLPGVAILFGICTSGLYRFNVTTDPVQLWSASNSRARLEKDYFDQNFGPFYRTEQVIITAENYTPFVIMAGEGLDTEPYYMGPVMNKEVFFEAFYLQQNLSQIVAPVQDDDGKIKNVTLEDICFQPLSPDNKNCTIESVFNYFQNNLEYLTYQATDEFQNVKYNASWHIHYCTRNPTALEDKNVPSGGPDIPCLGAYGGPIDPNTIFGGFTFYNGMWNYENASAMIITFIVNNHVDDAKNKYAEAWEKKFIEYLKNYEPEHFNMSFTSERSITDEINRESQTDILTIAISYGAMFLYIAIFLGHFRSCFSIFVDVKITLGLFGVLIVIVAVAGSIGLLSYARVMASLIILEVVPFLVLAVGVDNLFILVHSYERVQRKYSHLPVDSLIGRALAEVAPSLLLTASSESAAFLLGAISSMPAVRSFSLYAGVAVFFNFILQISAFVSVMALDAKRQRSHRMDICCIRLDKTNLSDSKEKPSILFLFMDKIWTKIVLHPLIRPVWLFVFGIFFFAGMCLIPRVQVGLDQRLALPSDSFLQDWFNDMNKYLHIGPPVYFVIGKGFNYSDPQKQKLICSGSGCDEYSLGGQLSIASRISNYTRIAEPGSIWLDTYYQWLGDNSQCCGVNPSNYSDFCDDPQNGNGSDCVHCLMEKSQLPNVTEFLHFLPPFLDANPTVSCAAGGHAAFKHSVKLAENNSVITSNVMTFHTILRDSSDFIAALKHARDIGANLTKTLNNPVFPYSVFYVYYEQYLHIYQDMALNIGVSMGAVFFVTVAMLGLNVWGALIIIAVVFMILVNMGGAMALFGITANAVSLVNLVMTVGISVEFCSHITRWFISCPKKTKLERATSALANMGSSVFSGITITKFIGVFILVFAKSQLFEVYYFRMYMSMVVIGAAHGLIFLPVFLSYVGPPYCPVKTPSPYPPEFRAAYKPGQEPVVSSSVHQTTGHTLQNGQDSLYPNLDSMQDQYGGYPAPTRPKSKSNHSERTPLLS